MAVSLQVIYPTEGGTTFDYTYYTDIHLPLVDEHMGKHIDRTVVTRGTSGGPDAPAGCHAIATIIFADQQAMDDALAASAPVLADIPKFTDSTPQMLFGEVIG